MTFHSHPVPPGTFRLRSTVHRTSSAVSRFPEAKTTPSRRWNVYTVPSADTSHDSASIPFGLDVSSIATPYGDSSAGMISKVINES